MFRSRFFWRLFGGYALVVLVFSAIVGLSVSRWVAEDSLQNLRESLLAQTALLGQLARGTLHGSEDPAGLQTRVRELGIETGTRLTVIADDGLVLADSAEDPANMSNHSRREEILRAAEIGMGFSTRLSATMGREMIYCAQRIETDSRDAGFVRASLPIAVVDDRLQHVRWLVLSGAGIAAAVALVLGWFFARRVTSRLAAMTRVARAMAAGDYSQRVPTSSQDEIGKLATAYNAMAAQMKERIDTITKDRNAVQAILRSMVEGVVAVDRDERVLHMNAVAGDLLAVTPDEVIGERIWEATRANEIAQSLSASLAGRRVYRTQARMMRGETEFLLDISASPLTDGENGVTGALVVFHDVTEMRRLELVRREFVINASHELKTPITAICGFLDTIAADPDIPDDVRRSFVERASRQAERLSALVTDLLRLSRLEGNGEPAAAERIDLGSVARDCVAGLLVLAGKKQVQLTLNLGKSERFPVLGDRGTLRLVLDNLVDNALKYTPAGGHVEVRARIDASSVVAEVEDDGIGISSEDTGRIFERFYRVDKARSREVGGTGLGLAIAKHACTVLGGELSVRSQPGQGSTFALRLPLAS